jgi:hypothetical protein
MKKNTTRRDDGKAAHHRGGRPLAQGYLQIMHELKRLTQIIKSNVRHGHGSAGRHSPALHDN